VDAVPVTLAYISWAAIKHACSFRGCNAEREERGRASEPPIFSLLDGRQIQWPLWP